MRAVQRLHHRLLCALLLACAGLLASAAWAQAEGARRVALVIGNSNYTQGPLLNPVNDARAMAKVLQSAGFTVILKTDVSQPEFLGALRDFGNRLKDGGPGTAGLFYFAGHGMQVKGRNFLIPLGANIEHEDELAYQALDAQAVMDKMESAGNGTNIVILDACRNNPFVRSFRSGRQGLAQMDAPVGTLVAFSTAPGSVASDGKGANGLYTSHLLRAIQQPGQKVEDVFKQVRFAVLRDSARKQVPWEASSLVGDFYFVEPRAGAPGPGAALPPAPGSALDPQAAIDEALWSAVKDSNSSAELFAYLNRFPAGLHAKEARARLANLVAPVATSGNPARPSAADGRRPLSEAEVENVLRSSERSETEIAENIAQAQRRIEEIVTWGEEGTDKRPANPKRNAHAFTEGDRYRYRILDQISDRYTLDYLWRIDRLEPDGSLWVNDGAQRFDPQGQLRGGTDEFSGQWVEWTPALPLAAVASQAPSENPLEHGVASTVQWRNAEGRITRASLRGKLHGPRAETIQTLAGLVHTRRLDAYLDGPAVRSTGEKVRITLNLTWWFAPGVGLPVRLSVDEREDDRLVRRTLHDLTAMDVRSSSTVVASPWVKP